jgi:hypothetical protein
MKHVLGAAILALVLFVAGLATGTLITADQIALGPGLMWQTCVGIGPCLTFNTALLPSKDTLQSNACTYAKSTNGTTAYTYSFGPACKALTKYTEGMRITLWVDTSCVANCSVNFDNTGIVSIKLRDTSSDPGQVPGSFVKGQPKDLVYTPALNASNQFVFVLME